MTNDYHLPESAEASIVGCVLLCPDIRDQASKLIAASDFRSEFYAAAFFSALELEEPDSVAFCEKMKTRGFDLPDGFFRALGDAAISRANLELYASLLHEEAQKRHLNDLSREIADAVADGQESTEIIASATDKLKEIDRSTSAAEVASPADACAAFWDHRERVETGEGSVPTGFRPLDDILSGGMLRSGLYILAARPGTGKTTCALQFADHIAANVGPVLFVSLEMSVEQIQGKRLARRTGIPSDEILLGNGETLDYMKVKAGTEILQKLPVYISRRPAATVAKIRRMAKGIAGIQCVVVDYLGKISPAYRRSSRYESTTEISNDLKTLAVELGVPVLCLAQLNRENTGRNDKRPQLSDLRDSGAIEQDADGVVMLHRADYYEMTEESLKPWESVPLEIIVRKNRHGKIGSCTAGFFPATGKIIKTR